VEHLRQISFSGSHINPPINSVCYNQDFKP
jgi:hypothetical protein